jgi:hypothetical protein
VHCELIHYNLVSLTNRRSLESLRVDSILGALRVDSMLDVSVVAYRVRAARPTEGVDGPSMGRCHSPAAPIVHGWIHL